MGFFSSLFHQPKPKQPKISYKINLKGTEGRVPVIYGQARIEPTCIFKHITGKDNEFLLLVDVYCEGRIEAINEIYLDDKPVSDRDEFYGSHHGKPYIRQDTRLTGELDQHGFPQLTNWNDEVKWIQHGDDPGWRDSDRLQGLAASFLVLRNHPDSPFSGEPQREGLVTGRCIWDPRDEEQKQDDEASWLFSDNPALCLLDYLRNPRYGKGLALSRINLDSFIDAANFCDQEVEGSDGNLRKLMTCNIELDTDNSIMDNVQTLLKGMRGSLPQVDGQLTLVIEQDTPGVMQLTEDDLVDGISIEGEHKDETYNRVIVKFKNPEADYQDDEAYWPPEGDLYQQWLDEDFGVELEKSITVDTCADREEALQMAEVICRRSRFNMTATITCQPRSLALIQEDVIELTSSVRQWENKPFRVEKLTIDDELNVELDLREHQNSIYPWTPKHQVTYPPETGYKRAVVPWPEDIQFTAIEGNANYQGKLTWAIDNDDWIIQYRVNVYRDGELMLSAEPMVKELYFSTLEMGQYSVSIVAITNLGKTSDESTAAFAIEAPPAPNGCEVDADNFTITLRPSLAYAPPVNTEFEFYTTGTDQKGDRVFLSRGRTLEHGGLLPATSYYYQIRTVNPWGQSAYLNVSAQTKKDPAAYLDLLDGSITQSQLAQELLKPIQRIDELDTLDAAINSLNQAKALIDQQLGQLNDQLGTVNTQIEEVQTEADGNAQRITSVEASNEQIASRAAQLEDVTAEQAQSLEVLETTTGEQGASIQQLLQTDSTKARRTSWLQSQLEDAAAELIMQEEASGDETRRAMALNVHQGENASSVESLQQVTTDQAQTLEQLETQQGQQSAQIEQTAQTINDVNSGLSAMWKVSLGVTSDGKYYAAGFGAGIENTDHGLQSSFGVLADRFFVLNKINGTTTATSPFVIQNGKTFINTAVIGDATIDSAKIKRIDVDKINFNQAFGGNAKFTGTIDVNQIRFNQAFGENAKFTGTVDVAHINFNEAFGQNATFNGTVYARNLSGDVVSVLTAELPAFSERDTSLNDSSLKLVSWVIEPEPFERCLIVNGLNLNSYVRANWQIYDGVVDRQHQLNSASATGPCVLASLFCKIPANQSKTIITRITKTGSVDQAGSALFTLEKQTATATLFKAGHGSSIVHYQ